MSERFYLSLLAVAFACVIALVPVSPGVAAGASGATSVSNAFAPDEAERALAEGASLLRRNRADQALPLLESALKLFTQSNNRSGLAAAHASLGDLYLRHGQYATALEHFQHAADIFRSQRETANAALMFAKLGETYYLSGDEQAARAAFARIGEGEKRDGSAAGAGGLNAGASGGSSNNNSGSVRGATGVLTFASLSTLLPDSCLSLTPNDTTPSNGVASNVANNVAGRIIASGGNAPSNPAVSPLNSPAVNPPSNPTTNPAGRPSTNPSNNPTNNPSNNPSGNSPNNNLKNPSGNSPDNSANRPSNKPSNNEPRNMGRAPKKLDDLGRMDLRVFDEQGNPVKGAKARLTTTRPNGIFCDCDNVTDATGRAVLPAIHIGKELKLEVKAPGFESLEQIVPAEQLAEPFKVTLQSKNATTSAPPRNSKPKFAHAVFPRRPAMQSASQLAANAANALSAAMSPVYASACFDFYRLFNAYATGELRLARADFDKNQLGAAQARYLNVLAAADRDAPAGNLAAARLFRAVSRTSLGDIALRQSRFAEALKYYEQAAEIARADGRAELTWGAERGLGKTYWVMAAVASDDRAEAKNRTEAIKHYRAALAVIETLYAGSLRADDARSNFLATTKDVFDEAASALAELALMNAPASASPSRGSQASAHASNNAAATPVLEGQSLVYAAEAFRVVEQSKARSLLDMLADARAEVREGVPAALLERKAANMARQQEIANLFGGVSLKTNAPTQTIAELEAELERLTREFNSLENQIRTSSPRYAALVRAEPLTLAEVQQKVLDDSTALLEYNLGAQQSYLFAATKSTLTIHRLPSRAAVERQAIELRQLLVPAGARRAIAGINVESTRGLALGAPSTASANVSAYTTAAHALYKTVVAPAAALVGERRMLVVPDGALNYVPFESLVTNAQGADYSALSYLVKTNEIAYAPSASVIAVVRQTARRDASRAGGSMLLVADPVFDASDARAKNSAPSAETARDAVRGLTLGSALADVTNLKGKLKLVRLDGTRSEAEEIAKLARAGGGQADVWLDFDANEANLHGRKLDNYRVVHFATHGLLNAERPQFTGLALSLVGQTQADGFLRVDEVFNLRLGSPLVMLSACETGLGKERRGEGVIGLTRAFMYAGAPTVGVSLWSVADKSTAELMPEFYRRLLAGEGGAPAAMRAAQLSMIAGKRYSAPFYWSPFVMVGDWR